MKKWIALSLLISILVACQFENKKENEIKKIKVTAKFALFHDAFFSTDPKEIFKLKENFPYMFPNQVSDKIVLARRNDTLQQALYKEVSKVYGNFEKEKGNLVNLFKHIKYYYVDFVVPTVVTDITGVSYQDRVLYANDMLLLSLDMYLGENHKFYTGFPGYLTKNFRPDYMIVEVAKKIIEAKYSVNRDRTFLGQMIFEGKKMYLLDLFLPHVPEQLKFGYSKEKMLWANKNEAQVWAYFIKQEMLYSNNPKLKKRFLDLAPFSKFYMSIDKDSPGEIGTYIGLQIVRAYMKNHEITPQELLNLDAQTLLNQSGFKPKK